MKISPRSLAQRNELNTKQQELFDFHVILINYACHEAIH